MRSSVVPLLVFAVAAAGCASSPRPTPERREAPPTVQLRTWVSVSGPEVSSTPAARGPGDGVPAAAGEPAPEALPAVHADGPAAEARPGAKPRGSAEERIREQMELVRALSLRADAKFLAAVENRVPFAVKKEPWKDRPVIELSLDEVRMVRDPGGDRVKLRLGLVAELPEAGISLDRDLVYERPVAEPGGDLLHTLGPAVEEAAALAAGWLLEAAAPDPEPEPEAAPNP
jgi:hypothetical protein